MAEWLKALDSKSSMGETPSRVQIPLSPQNNEKTRLRFRLCLCESVTTSGACRLRKNIHVILFQIMSTLLILFLAGTILTVGDLLAGRWIVSNSKNTYIAVLVSYMIGLNFLVWSYKFEDIAVASITMEIFNITTLTLAGIFLFKERITKTELAGICIGLIAVIILEIA